LGAVIKARRQELGWTQEELAERISRDGEYVRQSEISRIESGKIVLPRRDRLERIAAALDLPLGELLARSGWAGAGALFAPQTQPVEQSSPHPASMPRVTRSPGGRADAESRDCGAIGKLRRAVETMREESDRLCRNRQVAAELSDRLSWLPREEPAGLRSVPVVDADALQSVDDAQEAGA
jgi:transcriptional regulator with XRE-family HTH domain